MARKSKPKSLAEQLGDAKYDLKLARRHLTLLRKTFDSTLNELRQAQAQIESQKQIIAGIPNLVKAAADEAPQAARGVLTRVTNERDKACQDLSDLNP